MDSFLSASPAARHLLELLFLSSTLLMAAWLASALARRASAASRHLIWSLAVVGCLALPLMSMVLPARVVPLFPSREPGPVFVDNAGLDLVHGAATASPDPRPGSEAVTATPVVTGPNAGSGPGPALLRALPWAWAMGSLLLLVQLLGSELILRRTVRDARGLDDELWVRAAAEAARAARLPPERIRILQTQGNHAPMVAGLLRPVILIPCDAHAWSTDQRLQFLHHEVAHLKRRDGSTQILASLVATLYWLNPLAWLAVRKMLAERERACDDQVLNAGADPTSYAHHLLAMARRLQAPRPGLSAGVAMARPSEMSGRLLAILDAHRNRRSPGRSFGLAIGLTTLAMTMGLASVSPGVRADHTAADIKAIEAMDGDEDLISAAGRPAEEWSVGEIRAAIDRANRRIEQGVANGDVEAMLEPFSVDMALMAANGAAGHGLQDMRKAFGAVLANFRRLTIEVEEVERINAGLIYEIGRYRYDRGREPRSTEGRYLSIWRYESGQWQVYRSISNF